IKKIKALLWGNEIPNLIGDPTEVAVVKGIYNLGYTLTELRKRYRTIAEEGFTSERKRMSVLIEKPDHNKEIWVKGAAEVVFARCSYIEINGKVEELSQQLKKEIIRANNLLAGEALRVLAIAYKKVKNRKRETSIASEEKELILLGLIGMMDPPRKEAYEAVKKCYTAGIRPVMITGDHKLTATVIASKLGIIKRNEYVLTGNDLRKMDNEELRKRVKDVKVFARITPEDKLRIVKSLKKNGDIVAMTGDGVNDAPAIKEADIGIAMGQKGTDVTKEASSLILADDNFATIVKAIEEGRKIYNNIRKFIRYLLSCNTGELLTIFIGILMGLPLPLLPIQILWVNLVTDGLPALALGMDKDSEEVMNKPPRSPRESIFAQGMIAHIICQGTLIGISTTIAYLLAIYKLNCDLNTARTMAFTTLVFSQMVFVFSCRSENNCLWEIPLFSNIYLVIAVLLSVIMQFAVIYIPFLQYFFKTTILSKENWLIIMILSISSTLIIDLIKKFLK
ncbi:MAG TPA: cation-transporting P-type ATPase, partial [Halanaerobiales bacterium]|nr:cation-transporting P-type ATPase [Halanaerobiales bacterium]